MIKQGMNILEQNEKKRLDFNPDLKQINFLDRRVYKRSEGVYYPSVTTILQYMPKNKFFETWLKDVGHNADLIMRKAGKEGTQVHEACERLVKGQEVSWMDDYGNARNRVYGTKKNILHQIKFQNLTLGTQNRLLLLEMLRDLILKLDYYLSW